jgi:fucose permease
MKRNYFSVALVFLIFFVISFITNILGPIIPDIIDSFKLSLTMAGFLPFFFFVAYGVMSIPAGILAEQYSTKSLIISAFTLATAGAFLFAGLPLFPVALLSLFFIGAGMAILQVVINPLLRAAGGEEHFAFNSVAAQLVFGGASFLSPMAYTYLVENLKNNPTQSNILIRSLAKVVPANLTWISLYWIFACITLTMVIIIALIRLPKTSRTDAEKAGAWQTHIALLKNNYVILYFVGIFCYVGCEQGIANWMSKFLSIYHGIDPLKEGAAAVSYFWGLLTVGCFLGLILLKLIDSRKILTGFSIAAIVCLTAGLFGSAAIALIAFPAIGFCLSVMWSIIFSLALNSVPAHHGSFSGILCTGIAGGAVIPLIIGGLGDMLGLRFGMIFIYIILGFILSIGFWAKPLINNATFSRTRKNKQTDPTPA